MEKTQLEKEDIAYRQQVVNEYRADVEKLARYLPWLESKKGMSVQQSYSGSGIEEHSIAFPVYDGTLMTSSGRPSGRNLWTEITDMSIQGTGFVFWRTSFWPLRGRTSGKWMC